MPRRLSLLLIAILGVCAGCDGAAPPAAGWHEAARFKAGRTAGPVTLAGRWAFVPNMGDGTVTQIDRAARRVVATIPVSDPQQLLNEGCAPADNHAYFYGSWGLRECNTPFALGWDGRSLWAIDNGARQLVQVDPVAHLAGRRIDLPGKGWDISIAGGTAWVSGYWDDAVYRVDLARGQLVGRIDGLDHGPAALATGPEALWVVCARAGRVLKISPTDSRVVASFSVERWSVDVVPLATAVLIRGTDGHDISRLGAADGSVQWTSPGPMAMGYYGVDHVGVAPNGVWLSGPVTARVDAATGEIAETIRFPSMSASFEHDELWLIGLDGSVSLYARR